MSRAEPGRRLAVAVALVVAAPLAGCGGDRPVSPLPVRPPVPVASSADPSPSASAASATPTPPGPSAPPAAPPTSRPAPRPAPTTRTPAAPPAPSPSGLPAACQGAVRYELVLAETELALLPSLCFATGAVLVIRGIGPGEVTVDREDLVSRGYEAGVVDIRFVRPGTVAVLIPQGGATHTVTVVVRG
jgi:hypothetical protein